MCVVKLEGIPMMAMLAKTFVTQLIRVYRDSHGFLTVIGILYNHESPRRGEGFVKRKICRAADAIKVGQQDKLKLGDTSARRDWGMPLITCAACGWSSSTGCRMTIFPPAVCKAFGLC